MDRSDRIAIWAAVSSRPQAEKDSVTDQLAAGRAFVQGRGATLAAELVVPGESRSYPTMAEAIAGMGEPCAYTELLALLSSRSIDVLWCRSLDRLGRTDPLIAEVQWRCQQAGAVVWSEQMPPTGQATGDLYLSAIERAGAQREMIELKRRTQYGMNARARKGHMMAGGRVPFGYTGVYVGRVRMAVVNPNEAAAFRWMVQAFLERTHTDEQIHARMRELFPERVWPKGSVHFILRNPFYAGLVVRNTRGPDGLPLRIEAPGQHEPLIDLDTYREIQRYLDVRSERKRPPARTLWAGLVVCDYCGGRMHALHAPLANGRQGTYYRCANYIERKACVTLNHVPEHLVTAGVVSYLRELYDRDAGKLLAMEGDALAPDHVDSLERQRASLVQRRDRLTLLFQTDRITLQEFDGQRAAIVAELNRVDAELTAARAQAEAVEHQSETVDLLRQVLPELESRLATADPVEANRWLRDIFREIRIRDKRVVSVSVV